MSHYLVAAEANKIQDFVFRSTRLREVVGGSQLLRDFCAQAPAVLHDIERDAGLSPGKGGEFIVNDGGSFTVLFHDPAFADRFRRAFPARYAEATGGVLTAGEPEPWNGVDGPPFVAANSRSRARLNLAKRAGGEPVASEHLPYAAYCASCGVALAVTHATRPGVPNDRGAYLCPTCGRKADVRPNLPDAFARNLGPNHYFEVPMQPENTALWDPRGYVAYIIADGNGMGRIFNALGNRVAVETLSGGLTDAVLASLADAAAGLITRAPEYQSDVGELPALPLIVGGDDVFMRVPAPYALDFAGRFAAAYEKHVGELIKKAGADLPATVGIGVVICKASYPHYLAHRYGERLEEHAKKSSKAWARVGQARSAVAFGIVLGSRLPEREDEDDCARVCASLKPYWVGQVEPDMGASLQSLIDLRYQLKDLPRGRLVLLEGLFAAENLPKDVDDADSAARWQRGVEELSARVALRNKDHARSMSQALAVLGGDSPYPWRNYVVLGPHGGTFRAHGLPDLLDAWAFSLDMGRTRAEYLPEEDRS